jgi:hypothetical protein
MSEGVLLGFFEKQERSGDLLRHFFPSKAGGMPVSSCLFSILNRIQGMAQPQRSPLHAATRVHKL